MSTRSSSLSDGARSSVTGKPLAVAKKIEVQPDGIRVRLSDGRVLSVRYADYDFLRDERPEKRSRCVVHAKGTALWWPRLLEGISVAGLIDVSETELEEYAGLYD